MKSGADHQYNTMTIADLKQLDVNAIADDDCILVMWWVGAMPQEAIDLVGSWGFTLKNMVGIQWNKLTKTGLPFFGMGFWTRAGAENCIIATKGKPKPASRSVRAVINAEQQIQFNAKTLTHSEKPHEVRDMLVTLAGDVPRLEMFARQRVKGWDAFGNEVEGSIEINAKP